MRVWPHTPFLLVGGYRPQTPLNSPVPGLAARSCGTLLLGWWPSR